MPPFVCYASAAVKVAGGDEDDQELAGNVAAIATGHVIHGAINTKSFSSALNDHIEAAQDTVDASAKLEKAKANLEKADTPENKAALEQAQTDMDDADAREAQKKSEVDSAYRQTVVKANRAVFRKQAASTVLDTAKGVVGVTSDIVEAVTRAANQIGKKDGAAFREIVASVKDDLTAIFNDAVDSIKNPKTAADAIDDHLYKNVEAPLQQAAGATRDDKAPVTDNFRQRAEARIDKWFQDNPGEAGSVEEEQRIKESLLNRIMREQDLGDGTTAPREPNLYEAESIRRGLKQFEPNETKGYNKVAYDVANFMREVINEGYEKRGIDYVAEARGNEAKLITISKALRDAQTKFENQTQSGTLERMFHGSVMAGAIGSLLGYFLTGPVGALAGLGELLIKVRHGNVRDIGLNLDRALELAGRNPDAEATTPTITQNNTPPAPPTSPTETQGNPVAPKMPPRPLPPAPAVPPAVNHGLDGALDSFLGLDSGDPENTMSYQDKLAKYYEHAKKLRELITNGGTPETPVTGPDGIKRTLGEQLQITSKMRQKLNTELKAEKANVEKQNQTAQAKYQKEVQKWEEKNKVEIAKAAEQAKAEAEKAKADAEARNEALKNDPRIIHGAGGLMPATEPVRAIVGAGDHTSEQAHGHEGGGHTIAYASQGLDPFEFISDTHPKAIEKGAAAAIRTRIDNAAPGVEGVFQRVIGMLGGPAWDEVHSGIDPEDNKAGRGDFDQAKKALREEAGLTPSEVDVVMKELYNTAKEVVSKPEAVALAKANIAVREVGLPDTHHMSESRMTDYVKALKGVFGNGETTTPTTDGGVSGKADGGVPEGKSDLGGTEAEKPSGRAEEVHAGEVRKSEGESGKGSSGSRRGVEQANLEKARESVRKERTTGDEKIDETIRQAGGVPSGSAKNFPFRNAEGNFEDKNAAYITEPKYGSTGIIPFDEVTPERIKSEMERMRAAWEGKTEQSNLTRRAGVGGVGDETPEESYFAQQARGENYRGRGARANSDADMGNGGKAWLSTKGEYDPQDRIHSDYDKNFAKSNVRIGNLEGDGKLLVHSQGPLNEAQRIAVAADIRKQGGAIYDFEGSTDSPGGGLRGEATTVGDFMHAHDKAYPPKTVDNSDVQELYDNLKGVEQSNLSKTKAQSVADKIKEKYGTTDSVEPLRREHSFIHPDGSLTHLEGTQHGDAIAEAGGGNSNERNNWDNRPEFVNKSGVVRAHGFQNRAGDNLSFSVPKDGVTPEQLETMRRAAAQGFLRNGNLNIERADVGADTKDQLSKQKSFPRGGDVDQMLRDIQAHPSQKVEQSNLAKADQVKAHEENGGSTFSPEGENLSGKDLYSVALHPENSKVVDELTPAVLDAYKAEHPGQNIGTWKDPDTGKTWLDTPTTIADRDAAIAAGKAANQKAIYHLGTGETIPTGGTGESPTIHDRAKAIANSIGGKVVGSAAEAGSKPNDIDIHHENYNNDDVEAKLKELGFEHFGSQLVSPKEAAKSGKPYGNGWQRGEYFEHPDGTKLDVWHDATGGTGEAPAATPGVEQSNLQKGTISTRLPSGKKATENPLGDSLTIGRDSIDKVPGLPEKVAAKIKKYTGIALPAGKLSAGQIIDHFTNHMKENLKDLYNQVEPEKREANAKWYDSANRLANNMKDAHGISEEQASGTIAAMSPQKDWDQNASLAERVTDIWHNKNDIKMTPEMMERGKELSTNRNSQGKLTNPKLKGILKKIAGKSLNEIDNPVEQAAWVRIYDEAHNPREYHHIDPATGDKLGVVMTDAGEPRKVTWGSLNEISKALSILNDGSHENISKQLGGSHKVRNFYNNILDPNNPAGHVTIDTHAVAAALQRALSGKSQEVKENFGTIGAKQTGARGLYALYADAYRQAAAELGIQPRQLQSVVWEKIREQFPDEFKRAGTEDMTHPQAIENIWKGYDAGKTTLEQTRQAVRDYAKDTVAKMEQNKPAAKAKGKKAEAPVNQGVFDGFTGQ